MFAASGLVTESINEITDVSETFKVFARVPLQGNAENDELSAWAGLVSDVWHTFLFEVMLKLTLWSS